MMQSVIKNSNFIWKTKDIKEYSCASSPNTPPFYQLLQIGKLKASINKHKSILPNFKISCLEFPFRINNKKTLKAYNQNNNWLNTKMSLANTRIPAFSPARSYPLFLAGVFLSFYINYSLHRL